MNAGYVCAFKTTQQAYNDAQKVNILNDILKCSKLVKWVLSLMQWVLNNLMKYSKLVKWVASQIQQAVLHYSGTRFDPPAWIEVSII